MQHIFSSIQSALSRRKYTSHMLARLALNELAVLLKIEKLEGYIRYHTLYVDLPDESDNIALFTNKALWLVSINQKIQRYDAKFFLKDIRYKKIRNPDKDEEFR